MRSTAEKVAPYKEQFLAYLAGERFAFDFPIDLIGTPFQQEVWEALLTIPYGQTATYGDICRAVAKSRDYARAVGFAIGRNPLPIVYPCHRIVGKDGNLTDYSAGFRGEGGAFES